MLTKKSFSLIEVLVFTTILTLFFIAAVSVSTFFLKNLKNEQYKIIATHLLEEANEWLKQEKEKDWIEFLSHTNQQGIIYCLKNLDWNNQGNCQNYNLGTPNIFKREMSIKIINNSVVEAEIFVYWLETNQENKVNSKSILTITE